MREVLDGKLEGIKIERSLTRFDFAGGEGGEDLIDGDLDGGAILDEGGREGFLLALIFIGRGLVAGMEIAEGGAAESESVAPGSAGKDVPALFGSARPAFGFLEMVTLASAHSGIPPTPLYSGVNI